jgi:hypothetical protein
MYILLAGHLQGKRKQEELDILFLGIYFRQKCILDTTVYEFITGLRFMEEEDCVGFL